ncbi:MAG: hypothetical protein ACKO5E_19190 [bacterium]
MTTEQGEQAGGSRRERSARYPSTTLDDAINFCRQIDELGVDGLNSAQIASAMGYRNVKTNTFSGRLSSARQFGLIDLSDQNHTLSQLARRIIHPMDPDEIPTLLRQACQSPPLYAELLRSYAGKRLPEPDILGNLLMHKHHITAVARSIAAEAFFASIKYAGILLENRLVDESAGEAAMLVSPKLTSVKPASRSSRAAAEPEAETTFRHAEYALARNHSAKANGENEVRIDLALWDTDEGKHIRFKAPSMISRASYERFLQAFQLAVRIVDEKVLDTSEPID